MADKIFVATFDHPSRVASSQEASINFALFRELTRARITQIILSQTSGRSSRPVLNSERFSQNFFAKGQTILNG